MNCTSAGALILRNSSTNEPCRHSGTSHLDWKEKVKIICLCARSLRILSDALAHLCPAPVEWKVEQLKADHWDSLTESGHKLLRLRSWIIRETTSIFWKKIMHFGRLKLPACFVIRQNPFAACLITWGYVGHGLQESCEEMSHMSKLFLWEIKDLIDAIKMKLSRTSGQQSPATEVWWIRQWLGRQQKHRGEQGPVCKQLHHLAAKQEDGRVLRREPVQWSRDKWAIVALLLRSLSLCMKKRCIIGFMIIVFSCLGLIACISAPLWRCWEEIAAQKSCKRCCISCRVLNSGDKLTSWDRSWSIIQGAVLCKWSAGEINGPHKRAKQSYLF